MSRPREVSPEVDEVRRRMAVLDGRERWPQRVTVDLVIRLRRAGLVPAAIADELGLSDAYVQKMLRRA
jgi:hypothetical protein